MKRLYLNQRLRLLLRNTRGVTIVEFAIIAPVLFGTIFATLDMGYQLYVRSILSGAMEEAARKSALESGAGRSAVIDEEVRTTMKKVLGEGRTNVAFVRRNYVNFSDVREKEPFTDSDGDEFCDNNEPFDDSNASGQWDDRGVAGQGGARAAVLYVATLDYAHLNPARALLGLADETPIVISSVLQNQPYDAAGAPAVVEVLHCTTEDM